MQKYEPRDAFEALVIQQLLELQNRMDRHQYQHDRLEPAVKLYETLVPMGLTRWMPEVLEQAASSSLLRTMTRRRLKMWAAVGAAMVVVPSYLSVVIELGRLLRWW